VPSLCIDEEPSDFFPAASEDGEEPRALLASRRKDNPKCNWMAKASIASDRTDRRTWNKEMDDYLHEMAFGSLYLFEIGFYEERIRKQALKMLQLINMCPEKI